MQQFEGYKGSSAAFGIAGRSAQALEKVAGLIRSILIYHGQPFRHRHLVRFYSQFIQQGDLCFDIGAHLGSRTRAWLKLGARVVAVEPQPMCMDWLRRWFEGHNRVELVPKAVGSREGRSRMWLSRLNPAVSTLSRSWRQAVGDSPRFSGVRWQDSIAVEVTTFDVLIAKYGRPAFCKIDVEGSELDVLEGCSVPLKSLSFEFVPPMVDTAVACIDRLGNLGDYEYQWGVGEPPSLRGQAWVGPREMKRILADVPPSSKAGDVYARHLS